MKEENSAISSQDQRKPQITQISQLSKPIQPTIPSSQDLLDLGIMPETKEIKQNTVQSVSQQDSAVVFSLNGETITVPNPDPMMT